MLVFKIIFKNSATPQVHIYRYIYSFVTNHIHGLLSQPNKCSLYYAIRVLKVATDRDLLHTILSLQNIVVYIMTCAVYSNIHYSQLCIAAQLSCILRLECKHVITITHTKFTRAMALVRTK